MDFFRDRNSPIQTGFNFSVILTNDGVISAGNNDENQLGRKKKILKDVGKIEIPGEKIIMISANHSYHCLFYTNLKRVYKTVDKKGLERIKFFDGKEVIAMKTKSRSSYVVTKEGIFSFGGNAYNELCHIIPDQNPKKLFKPPQLIKFPKDKKVVSFSCGWGHFMSCFLDGTCYGCGFNSEGNLGLGHLNDVKELTEVKHFRKKHIFIIQVSCGYAHNTVYLSNMGHCFVSGQALYVGFQGNFVKKPKEHKSLRKKKIVRVIAGSNCTSFVSKENDFYFVGLLNFMGKKKKYFSPIKFNTKYQIVDYKCGGEYGQGFHLFYDIYGKVYACGNNLFGQCFSNSDEVIEEIFNIPNIRVILPYSEDEKAFRNCIMENRKFLDTKIINH